MFLKLVWTDSLVPVRLPRSSLWVSFFVDHWLLVVESLLDPAT